MKMPRYRGHEVSAMKITGLEDGDTTDEIVLRFEDGNSVSVTRGWINRHQVIGDEGYYVVYDNGEPSWMAADLFEEQYTRIS